MWEANDELIFLDVSKIHFNSLLETTRNFTLVHWKNFQILITLPRIVLRIYGAFVASLHSK